MAIIIKLNLCELSLHKNCFLIVLSIKKITFALYANYLILISK